tara:strand:+ start:167 stop:820 length:654 start_codon:yes stop_codon:yes gene_type:complete
MNDKHDPALLSGAFAGLEAAVNRALMLAPASAKDLAAMSGTMIAIECTAPLIEAFITIESGGTLHLASYSEDNPATRVRGSLNNFVELAAADDPAATLINSDLEILGNSAPLIALQQIVSRMDVDWEAPLVDVLGDVGGHQAAQLLRGAFSWGGQAANSLRRQLSEFILEEGRLSPPAAELEHFYGEVQALGLRVERLQSRLKRLSKRITKATQVQK